ncbi:MAG: helix-turn-helix transcriptional regulator [Christensenellales bacterium]|nr:helix-turn-helix transcriptional regulator [Christensenellales bacterium]
MSRLGDTIRTARLKARMTEKALGKKCGMAENVIKDIESGRRIVSDEQAQRILKLLGSESPVSAELEVAAEPTVQLRPKPRAYVVPLEPEHPQQEAAARESSDAWLDALGGVVKRVPVCGPDGIVIDHVLVPVIGGKIEGGAPDKVLFYRCGDNALRGFRVHAGDLLLTIPASKPEDEALMLIVYQGKRMVRKLLKLDGSRLQLQSFDMEFSAKIVHAAEVQILGRCVRLQRTL